MTGAESHFGLFRHDRTPKPAARAIHFLSQLLNDTSGKTDALSYSFANLPIGISFLLLFVLLCLPFSLLFFPALLLIFIDRCGLLAIPKINLPIRDYNLEQSSNLQLPHLY